MTTKQKIWLGVFLAMFLVPEILWSPVGNFYYELIQTSKGGGTHPYNNNFLQISDNLFYLKFVIFLQFLGLVLFFISFLKNSSSKPLVKWFFSFLFLVGLIMVSFCLYFIMTFTINIL